MNNICISSTFAETPIICTEFLLVFLFADRPQVVLPTPDSEERVSGGRARADELDFLLQRETQLREPAHGQFPAGARAEVGPAP